MHIDVEAADLVIHWAGCRAEVREPGVQTDVSLLQLHHHALHAPRRQQTQCQLHIGHQ